MKKWTALLLTGILTLSLGGCAKNARDLAGTISENEIYQSDGSGATAAAVESGVSKPADTSDKSDRKDHSDDSGAKGAFDDSVIKDDKVSDEAAAEQSDPLDEGESGMQKVYTQEHFGYKLTLDEDWEFSSDDGLKAQNEDLIKAAGNDEELAELTGAGNMYTDMMASNAVIGNEIIVRLYRMGLADVIGSAEKRNEKLADVLYAEGEKGGLENIEKTSQEVNFLGKTVTAVGIKGDLALSDDYTAEFWCKVVIKKKGAYASAVFVTGFTEFGGDNFQEILDRFEKI